MLTAELLILAVLGLAVGSFLTLVVERLDSVESIVAGRSHCNHCKKILSWWELLPFVGFLILRGKCSKCSKVIPKIYPLFELLTALAFVMVGLAQGAQPNYIYLGLELVFVSLLLVLLFYDWLTQTFPAFILYIALGFAVVLALVRAAFLPHIGYIAISDFLFPWLGSPASPYLVAVVGGLVGAGLLGLLAFPSKGQWMGYGDVILMAVLGIWLGYPLVIVALLLAFYAGAIVGGIQLYMKKAAKDHRIAFGPFLIVAAVVTRLYGEPLFRAIMKLWGVL